MKFPARAIVAVGLAVVGLLSSGCSASGTPSRADARDFRLPALRDPGTTISLASYAGRPLIITFFASWCPSCTAQTKLMANFYRIYHRKTTVIGIDSSDPKAAALSLVRRDMVTFPVAADPTLGTATAFGAPGLPAIYFLDAAHRVVARILGPVTWQQLSADVAVMDSPAVTDSDARPASVTSRSSAASR